MGAIMTKEAMIQSLLKDAYLTDGVDGLNRVSEELAEFIHVEGHADTVSEANDMAEDIIKHHMKKYYKANNSS